MVEPLPSDRAERELACKREYLFACLSAVLSSGPNAASELSVHALRRGFADLDDGKLLGSETVAKAVKKVLDLSQDATMLDIESMKAFFLSAGLSTSESQRCAKLAVVNKIPSPKKLSLLLFRDGPSALGLFSLAEEDGVLVRHALEQIYPVLVPPVSNYRRLSTLRRASVGLAISEEEAHHENLPMHAEEMLSRLKEVADSMTLTQLCSTLRQLLSLPDASLSEIVKAACKALGVRATGTLKEDATLCFFSAMEPAGGWKAMPPAALPAAPASVAVASVTAAEPFRPQQYPPHQPVTVGLPMAAPVQSKSLAAMLLPSTTFSPSPPRDRAVSQPMPGSGASGRALLALHGDRDRDQGQAGFGAPPTPLFFRDASSDKGAPHHAGTPPVLPTTVLPTLSTGTGTGTGGSSLLDTRSERTRSGASTSGSGGSFSPVDAPSSSSSPSLSPTPPPAPSSVKDAVPVKEETPASSKDEVKAAKLKDDNKPKSAKGTKASKEAAAAAAAAAAAQAEKPKAEAKEKEKEKVKEESGATALLKELVSEKLEGSDDAAPPPAPAPAPAPTEPPAPAPPALGPPEPEPEAADPSPPMARQASPLVRQHTKPHEVLSFAAEEPAPVVISAPDLASVSASAPSPVSAPAPAPVPAAPLSPITFPESAPSTPLAMMSVALDDTMLRLSPGAGVGAGREEGLGKAAAAAAAASAAAAAAVAAEAVAASTPAPEPAPAPEPEPAPAPAPAPASSSSSQQQQQHATSPVPSAAAVESTPGSAAPSAATPLSALTKTPTAKPDLRPTRSRSPADPAVPAPTQAPGPAPAASSVNLDQLPVLLAGFYRQHNPGREKDCAAILNAYRGRELELIRKLETQYRVPFLPPASR